MTSQKTLNLFKAIDKWLGTPLCYLLGWADGVKKQPPPNPNQIHRILLICWIGMGDVILTLPAVAALRQRYPNAHIAYLTTPRGESTLRGVPIINQIISYDIAGQHRNITGFKKILRQLRVGQFDLAIDFSQRYRLPILMAFWAKIPHRLGFAIPGQGRAALLTATAPYIWPMHETRIFSQLTQLAGASPVANTLPSLRFPTKLTQLPTEITRPFIAVHIGVGSALSARRWGADQFSELIDQLQVNGHHVVLTGSLAEVDIAKRINIDRPRSATNLVGQTSIPQLYHIFELASLVISPDTGPMHLAAASGTPTLGLFLASYPEKWAPYGPQHRYIYHGPAINPNRPTQHPPTHQILPIQADEVIQITMEMLK